MVKRNPWDEEEDELLKQLRGNGFNPKEMKEHGYFPKRTPAAISQRASKLRISNPLYIHWENKEIWECWILNKKGFSAREIGEAIGRTTAAVKGRMSHHGLFFHPPRGEPPKELQREVNEILGRESK